MMVKRVLSRLTNRLFELPILVLMPHSRCNCRCVMCDIWKANQEKRELSVEDLKKHLTAFRKFGLRRVALSGGEALMHNNLWTFCDLLRGIGVKISLLTTGVTLKQNAREVVTHVDDVIVSLDGPPEMHNRIRNIPAAFEKLEEGVKALKDAAPAFRITGRTVLQKQNFRHFQEIVDTARGLGFQQISFLAADISTPAFNRPEPWTDEKKATVALTAAEASELLTLFENSHADNRTDFDSGFIAESKEKLLDIARYYQAIAGMGTFPAKRCNAPWISAVVESNGDVLPCFFHPPYGNIHQAAMKDLINSPKARSFRKQLNVAKDPICQRCVCSLHIGLSQPV